ncbi:MAG: hypothetical protein ACI88H_003145 [Cocleimonas sp.]|jgi:hypothetical protein
MELLIALSIAAIVIASIIWYVAKVFISTHVEDYNKLSHFIDFKHLKELKTHDEPHVSKKAREHDRNIKFAVVVIITAVLILISQSVN